MSNTSKSADEASSEGQDERQNDFVLDILYQDARRVGSFLSQFDDAGLLKQVIEREAVAKGHRRSFKLNIGGGANVMGTGGTGEIGIERGPGEQGSEEGERLYDPFWTNTLTLLDFLEAAEMIQSDLEKARIGQFVKVSGALRIHDLATLQRLWELPTVRVATGLDRSPQGSRASRRSSGGKATPTQEQTAMEMGIEILTTLPHVVTARIEGQNGLKAWSSLREDGLTGSASDLFLKHGGNIAGLWSMIGVLDAEPDQGEAERKAPNEIETAIGMFDDGFVFILDTLGPPARSFLGRPRDAYGMTPLVIYREVSGG